jgi:hypothetical protein
MYFPFLYVVQGKMRQFCTSLLVFLVLRQQDESQCAECKGTKRHSAKFRENVTVPKCHNVDVIKCRTVKVSML